MNQYSQLLYFLKGLAESNPLVNTVTKGDPSLIDLEKANIFPLVHIDISAAGFTNGQTITFDVSIAALSQRDINKKPNADKFWKQDNEVDNHNETFAILNDIWTRMYRNFDESDITASENPGLEKITYEKGNILDGWELTFTVELPNTTLNLCM